MPEVSMPSVKLFVAAFAALALTGCAAAPPPLLVQGNPADAKSPVRPVAYRPVTAGYQSQRPVEPRPWRDQNDRVAPAR
jgi:hypothetical protein